MARTPPRSFRNSMGSNIATAIARDLKPRLHRGLVSIMRSQEVRALGELASEALGGATARIEEMHEGIAGRVFDSVGEIAAHRHGRRAAILYRRMLHCSKGARYRQARFSTGAVQLVSNMGSR